MGSRVGLGVRARSRIDLNGPHLKESHQRILAPSEGALLHGQSGADERRTASEPCCAGTGDGAGGSAVVGLDPDAEMIAALLPPYPSSPLLPEPRRQQLEQIRVMNKMKRANWIENFSSNLHN